MTKNKFYCDECGFYWEIDSAKPAPQSCVVCNSSKVHRSSLHKRFAKKSRPKIRRSFSIR
jgi:rubrerythrin